MRMKQTIKILGKLIAAGGVGYCGMRFFVPQTDVFCDVSENDVKSHDPAWSWNRNWDKRDPTYRVLTRRVSHKKAKKEEQMEYLEKVTSKVPRNILLIRHGQYNLKGECDEERTLTDLGRKQAEATGKRLDIMGKHYDKLIVSNMTRALETAEIIGSQLCQTDPKDSLASFFSDPLLREGAPTEASPPSRHWHPELRYYEDGMRIEAAFRKYFHRALPEVEKETFEVIVCHANVIRYFCCRALQFPADRWLQMSLSHGSITHLRIYPDGEVILMQFGDSSHMPKEYLTTSTS